MGSDRAGTPRGCCDPPRLSATSCTLAPGAAALEALSPKCHDLDDLMLDMLPEHDEEEEEKEEEEELEDEECNCPSAACDPQGAPGGGAVPWRSRTPAQRSELL